MLFTNTRQLEVADMSAAYFNIKINNCVFFLRKRQAMAIFCQKKTQLLALGKCLHTYQEPSHEFFSDSDL